MSEDNLNSSIDIGKPKPRNKKKGGIQWHSRESIEVVKRISRVSQYSPDEVIAVWGDNDEFRLRKQELKKAAQEMQQGRRVSDNLTFTTIGIADKVGPGRQMKKELRKSAWEAVLDEQELQEREGVQDDELLSEVYAMTSEKAKEKARLDALKLNEEVMSKCVIDEGDEEW